MTRGLHLVCYPRFSLKPRSFHEASSEILIRPDAGRCACVSLDPGSRGRDLGRDPGLRRGDSLAALGGRIRVGNITTRPWATVVGVIADERHTGVTELVNEKFFIAHNQWPAVSNGGEPMRSVFLVARTTDDPLSVAAAIRGTSHD